MEKQWLLKSLVFCFVSCLTNLMSQRLVDALHLDIQKSWQIRKVCAKIGHVVTVSLVVLYALVSKPDLFNDIINNHSDFVRTTICLTVGYHLWGTIDVAWNEWGGIWTNLMLLHHFGFLQMSIPAVWSMKIVLLICFGLISMVQQRVFIVAKLLKKLNYPSQSLTRSEHFANYTLRFLNWLCLFSWFLLNFHQIPNSCFIIHLGALMATPVNMLNQKRHGPLLSRVLTTVNCLMQFLEFISVITI